MPVRQLDLADLDSVAAFAAATQKVDALVCNAGIMGGPLLGTVQGYERLHAIHVRLNAEGRGGPSSRYEVENVLAPHPDVALAQVRRVALDPEGRPLEPTADTRGAFSEMALYVLVRRGGTWWLAAGQNTPIRPAPS